MKLYIKQKFFTIGAKFDLFDETGDVKYRAEAELFTIGRKLHLYSPDGREAAYIEQKLELFTRRYRVFVGGLPVADIVKEITLFTPSYRIEGLGWNVSGDFFAHEFSVFDGKGNFIASISKDWFSFTDCYCIEIFSGTNEIVPLSIVLAIDCVIDASRN